MLFEVQTQIGQLKHAGKELPTSHSKSELSSKIRIRLNQTKNELASLEKKLATTRPNSITRDELERRTRHLEKLQSNNVRLNRDFDEITARSHTTIASSIIRPTSSRLWEDDDDDSEDDLPLDATNPATEQLRTSQIISAQNEGLENLSRVISRQKELALKISEEVEEQDGILDDIAIQLDNTDGRINRETQAITTLSDSDSSWWYWMIIISLFVAIILVIFI